MATISNLAIANFPNNISGSSTPIFSWSYTGSPTLYELQIAYGNVGFGNVQQDVTFESVTGEYLLSPEFALYPDGLYSARLRGYSGTWGPYSSTLLFQITTVAPPAPIINNYNPLANGFVQTINGYKQANCYIYVSNNGGALTEATYPNGVSGTSWSYTFNLVSGNNNLAVTQAYVETIIGRLSTYVYADIYLATAKPTPYNVWNSFDELGLLLSLQRNPAEKNLKYRSRLLDVYQNPGNSTYQGLINGISRELGVPQSAITIDTLADLMDPTYPGNLLNSDGNALGTPLVAYADEVYQNNPVFLGTVISDQSYWDGVNQNTNGYIYLPHIWDASAAGIYPKWQGGGMIIIGIFKYTLDTSTQ